MSLWSFFVKTFFLSCVCKWCLSWKNIYLFLFFNPDQQFFFFVSVNSPCPPLSPSLEPNFLEVPHRSEVRFSTLPTQEHTASSRSVDSVHLPGGATPTHTYHQRWSNLGEGSPSWGTVQHTCRRPLTEYHLYSQDFSTSTPGHRDQVHQTCTVTRSITEVDLSEPNVSPNATLIQFML